MSQPAPAAIADCPAVAHLKSAIADGKHWYVALLEAMALWETPEEEWEGSAYRYLIGGEAFDWLRLAERLCDSVDGAIPDDERTALLFHGTPPLALSAQEMRRLLGDAKYRAYLNYLYGIIVEEALQQAVRAELSKERPWQTTGSEAAIWDETFRRLYGTTFSQLYAEFSGHALAGRLDLAALKEFTYWLFKYRFRRSEPARIASDTRKGILYLQQQRRANSSIDLTSTVGL